MSAYIYLLHIHVYGRCLREKFQAQLLIVVRHHIPTMMMLGRVIIECDQEAAVLRDRVWRRCGHDDNNN